MLAIGLVPEQFGVVRAGRPVTNSAGIADTQRILPIQSHNAVVLEINCRDPVHRGRQQERVVEADFQRARLHFGVPVDVAVAEAKMPFADDTGRVSAAL